LERALEDLDAERASGFSACPASERKKWKRDAIDFFETLAYRVWADSAGVTWSKIEGAYQIKCPEEGENV
jgi:hypothetical protein